MKTVILALFVLLVVSQSEALRCNCGGQKHCSSPVETCYGQNNVCAGVIIYAGSRPSYFKSCMKFEDCMRLNHPGISSATCCRTDLCN
uniref:phospholipase A2 inhibitor and Ly6/PLAUR domain-containing protein-like n=1 Tax=Scatophagus argus TaxID=75038 RepID=UPI001ED83C04|nr:phospholipase A2 inhibitor and Ly6/PLAUR domain-containing protein-like [Scatophagus argus]